MVSLAAAHGKGYVVKKMVKAAPQYQPYSVKSHGKKTHSLLLSCATFSDNGACLHLSCSQKIFVTKHLTLYLSHILCQSCLTYL